MTQYRSPWNLNRTEVEFVLGYITFFHHILQLVLLGPMYSAFYVLILSCFQPVDVVWGFEGISHYISYPFLFHATFTFKKQAISDFPSFQRKYLSG